MKPIAAIPAATLAPREAEAIEARVAESTADFEEARSTYRKKTALDVALRTSGGGAAGLFGGGLVMPVGAAVGFGTAMERALGERRGEARVEVDGVTREARWYLDPSQFARTPAEAAAELVAAGELGDVIPGFKGSATATDTPAALDAYAPKLLRLAKERRLVADVGLASEHGLPVASVVGALDFARLFADGKPVYVVKAAAPEEQAHSYGYESDNWSRTLRDEKRVKWVERSVSYELLRIDDPNQLARLPRGEGVPPGLLGIYRDRTVTSHVVAMDADQLAATSSDRWSGHAWQTEGASSRDRLGDAAGRIAAPRAAGLRLYGLRRVGALFGLLPGMTAGLALYGAGDPKILALGVATAIVGARLTTLVNRHTFRA